MAKYITTKTTTVWKSNPHPTGDFDASLAVRTLQQGTVVDVIGEGMTMTSWSQTPTLRINNTEWINKSDAIPYNGIVSSIDNIPAPVKGLLGLAAIFIFLKVVKVI